MLKILFWGLVLANVAMIAFDRGYLGSVVSDGREPARMQNQLNADKIKPAVLPPAPLQITPAMTAVTSASVPEAAATTPAEAPPGIIACTEIGNFEANDAKRFEKLLKASDAGFTFTQRNVKDVARHMVYIPSQGDKEGAEKKSGELKRLGVKDFYVIQDGSDMRWGISLGIFKTEEAARAHLANLGAKGVRSARIGNYSVTSNKVAFQLRELSGAMKTRLDGIKSEFPRQDTRECDAR